jgi:hypothetical protein
VASVDRRRNLPLAEKQALRPPPLLDQLPIPVIEEEEAPQLGSRGWSDETPVLRYLLVGEEFDWMQAELDAG